MQSCTQLEQKPMSPSPDQTRPPSKPPLPETTPADEQPIPVSDASPEAQASFASEQPEATSSSESSPLVPKRPLMRPVNRPQPPAQPPVAQKPPTVAAPPASRPDSSQPVAAVTSTTDSSSIDSQAVPRQQPIPPPSEPKQYRAIGLLRGRYTPSVEQFTRGSMTTIEGTTFEAVLLGRVMSLVKNHLDLEQDHLWVVYPRTRDTEEELHVQIVGVWEPEKLHKDESQAASGDTPDSTPSSDDADNSVPDYDDDYFSIRGEIVFYAPERENVVVKIQQAPRKPTDKAKAFKLQLKGVLPSEKVLGYFWDLEVKRQATNLVIISGTSIGLVPPKKKDERSPYKGDRKPFRKRPDRGGPPSRAGRPMGSHAPQPQRREALPKPSKRSSEPSSEG